MIERLIIEKYGCIQHLDLKLTPLHAFVGPNDSGKSTVLRAVSTCRAVRPMDRHGEFRQPTGTGRVLAFGEHVAGFRERTLRADPDAMRLPSPLVSVEHVQLGERGDGLAGVLDAITTRNVDDFLAIRADFLRLFPSVKNLGFANVDQLKQVQITLHDGTVVAAPQMSEGMLYWLAFRVLRHLHPAAVLLVEEPENGLHPARIRDVVRVLRDLSQSGTQVLIATHSPLVLNELDATEITVLTRTPETGTQATPLTEIPQFAELSELYPPGNLWVAFCDGVEERALLTGRSAP